MNTKCDNNLAPEAIKLNIPSHTKYLKTLSAIGTFTDNVNDLHILVHMCDAKLSKFHSFFSLKLAITLSLIRMFTNL